MARRILEPILFCQAIEIKDRWIQRLDLQPQSQIQYAMGTNVSMRLEVSYAWVGWELELNGRLKELPSIPCYINTARR